MEYYNIAYWLITNENRSGMNFYTNLIIKRVLKSSIFQLIILYYLLGYVVAVEPSAKPEKSLVLGMPFIPPPFKAAYLLQKT